MTRTEAQNRKAQLEKRRDALVDQLAAVDVQNASISSDSASRSFTNRSVSDLKAKIAFLDREIARLAFRLGRGPDPAAPRRIDYTFNG